MGEKDSTDIRAHFGALEDPRIERNKKHTLIDIVMIVFAGVICGSEGWEDIEEWGETHEEWYRSFLELPNGIPSHDTLRRVFARLDPITLQACIISWINSVRRKVGGEVIAIDGKTIRGSSDESAGQAALHSVAAWATESRLVLGQVKTQDKSNEIIAIPQLLELVDIKGCIVTIDAIGCQTKIAESIISKKGDYVLGLKSNQASLHENVQGFFETELANNFQDVHHEQSRSVEKDHGRFEIRECFQTDDLSWLEDRQRWKGLTSVIMIRSTREAKGKTSVENRYYISSLPLDAERAARAVRTHWSIENTLHYVLDVTFNEDRSRIRKDHAPENLAIVRRTVLGILKNETTYPEKSMRRKQKRAGWLPAYLSHLLLGTPYMPIPKKPRAPAP